MQRRAMILGASAVWLAGAARAARPPVVLELFTSQGCSSCPPADALLGVLARRPGVIALAWHVDYWNRLGWRDPYATPLATRRQRAYAARLRQEVYTPALVINGATMVVGSDRAAVERAMAQVPALDVPVRLRRQAGRLVTTVGGAAERLTVLLAAYDPQRDTPVGAGENAGRRLREYHIVRAVEMPRTAAGAMRQRDFADVAAGRGAAVLVQDGTLRVRGAADLAPA